MNNQWTWEIFYTLKILMLLIASQINAFNLFVCIFLITISIIDLQYAYIAYVYIQIV